MTEPKKEEKEEILNTKKVLLWSDDFVKSDLETTNILLLRWSNFELDYVESPIGLDLSQYVVVLIDYGLIGGKTYSPYLRMRAMSPNAEKYEKIMKDNIRIIKEIVEKKIPIAWCGGLPDRYDKDAKYMFPQSKFLHGLPSCGTSAKEIYELLIDILEVK